MNKELSHLTEAEVEELIKKYYAGTISVKNLKAEYNINTTKPLYNLFPPAPTKYFCPFCKVSLVMPYKSREYFKYSDFPVCPVCPLCDHTTDWFCGCVNCRKQKKERKNQEIQEQKDFLYDYLSSTEEEPVDFNSLSFNEKIYLGALLREGISEDYTYIKPLYTFINPLAPTSDYRRDIINHLMSKGIIRIHPDSSYESFSDIDIANKKFSYYITKVKWALNIENEGKNKVPLIESIITPSYGDLDYKEAYLLWRMIALHEVQEYFIYNVSTILDVNYTVGDKTITVFNDLLNDYSVAQIYSFIYRAINSALRFQKERQTYKQHAANTLVGNIQSGAERFRINGWEPQRYQRIKECPESALSKFFFERVLCIGDRGFNEVPRILKGSR